MKVNILGLDPAFKNVGAALVELDFETGEYEIKRLRLIQTEADTSKKVRRSSDNLRRAREIHAQLRAICKFHNVHYIMAEVPTGTQNARAANQLGIVTGVLACLEPPIIEVSPQEVKRVFGGKATKKQIIQWAIDKHPKAEWEMRKYKGEMKSVDGKNEHLADAVAAVEAGLKSQQWQEIKNAALVFRAHLRA